MQCQDVMSHSVGAFATPINQTYKYEVQRRAMPSGEWMTVARELTARDTIIRTIGELNYAFRIRAYLDDSTVVTWSNVVNTTIDETPPQIQAWINRGIGSQQCRSHDIEPRPSQHANRWW
jgi:hypothetical protein